jgi:oligopeptide transport system substrate-binding protein
VQLQAEPVTLDPALAEDGTSLLVLSNVMDGLVGHDSRGKLEPRLAESFQISDKGRKIEFKLRPGIQWSDGKPVTAADFVLGIQRSLAPSSASKIATLINAIKGARLYRQGKLPPSALGVRADGDRVIIELERAAPYFVEALTLSIASPSRQDVLDTHSGRWPENAPATGAYRIVSHENEQKWVLEKNPRYWNFNPREPDRVEFVIVKDESTGTNLFKQGKLDILTRVSLTDIPGFRQEGVLRSAPFSATYYLSFNLRKPPFKNRDLRRAVSGAINREELVEALQSGATPARSWVPPSIEGYIPYSSPASTFAESIAKIRKNPPRTPINAGFDSSDRNSMVMQKVQSDLRKNLGLELSLNNMDWKSYVKQLATDPPSLYRMGWLSPFSDPISSLEAFTTGNPNNYAGYANPVFDHLVEQIGALAPGPERLRKILAAEEILVDEDAALVPLFHYVQLHAVSSRVQGFSVNPFGVIPFASIVLR